MLFREANEFHVVDSTQAKMFAVRYPARLGVAPHVPREHTRRVAEDCACAVGRLSPRDDASAYETLLRPAERRRYKSQPMRIEVAIKSQSGSNQVAIRCQSDGNQGLDQSSPATKSAEMR